MGELWQCLKELGEDKGLHTRSEDFFFCRLHCNCIKLKCKVGTLYFKKKGLMHTPTFMYMHFSQLYLALLYLC